MVYATLTKKMLELIKSIKFSNFMSYDCASTFKTVYGNLRINTENKSVELTNVEKEMPFFDVTEDIACLACAEVDPNIEFKPYCIETHSNFIIGEKIVGIKIINDIINVNNGEYIISFDRAIVINTEKKTIMFSRGIWFSEVITISQDDDYDSIFSINDVIDAWSNEGKDKVDVRRSVKEL